MCVRVCIYIYADPILYIYIYIYIYMVLDQWPFKMWLHPGSLRGMGTPVSSSLNPTLNLQIKPLSDSDYIHISHITQYPMRPETG
jgi:hypothetical protein